MSAAIVDLGMGNLRSVGNAVQALGHEVVVANRPKMLEAADRIILPGVGAFGEGMRSLQDGGWAEVLEREVRARGKPFLGLCLGMQLMASTGTEHGIHEGLGWVEGAVERLAPAQGLRVPHIGWNDVRFVLTQGLYAGMGEQATFYFVHSYVLRPADDRIVSGVCSHSSDFAASIERDNLFATQFHPEKSQKAGLAVLKRFLEIGA